MVTLEIAKLHMRIDDAEDDSYINILITAAVSFIKSITAIENDATAPAEYDIAVLLLVSHWFQNREVAVEGSLTTIPYGLSVLLQNLRNGAGLI